MFLKIFFGVSLTAFIFLYLYEWRVERMRRAFLKNTSLKRFLEIVDLSVTSASSLLSFSSVVFSIWAGFGLIAPPEIKEVYGEDIFMILATASLCLVFYAITLYIYHLSQYFSVESENANRELEIRKDLFIRGESFFVFGTLYFLLTFLYSFVTLNSVLSPSLDCLIVVVSFGIITIIILIFVALRKLWHIFNLFGRMTMSKSSDEKRVFRPKFLTDWIIETIPLDPPFSALMFGITLYLMGLFLAWTSNLIAFYPDFIAENKTFHIAIVGISFCIWIFYDASNRIIKLFSEKKLCFDVSQDIFSSLLSRLERIIKSHIGAGLLFLLLASSLFIYALVYYPKPIFRDATFYTFFDYYVFFIFTIVLLFIGMACWGICAGLFFLRRLQRIPIHLEKIAELEPAVQLFLLYTVAYFFCVGLVYLAMPLIYTIFVVIIGYIAFMIPQIYLHKGIKLKKQEILKPLEERYWLLLHDFRKGIETVKKHEPDEYQRMEFLSSTITLINGIRNTREWVIDYSSIFKLLSSGAVVVLIKYLLTGAM